ncbi:MAG: glutamate--tRNA ligase [Alphaproteobacteria bacterium]|nr:glutamate--tRNA ligase [Alphaproteobacteria bacterium]
MSIVTRFPPSPTGMMHIGNARTALFNYLYARAKDGKFLVRIEDTDRARHSEEAVQVILDGLEWLGLEYDNTPESQYANKQRHIDVAYELLAAGKAYKCYCSPEELEEMREKSKTTGLPAYDRRWRDRPESDAPAGIDPVIRIKAPLEGFTIVDDKVQGEVKVENKQLDDMIILRSDGTPTYMLAVVVDDHDMGVTHVIRGDDHLNNTFRQNMIYDAAGWEKPTYAHLPLIHGPDGAKFSKRHGAVGLNEFQAMGYLPEALCNYLMRLGWAHGDEEIISIQRALEIFDFDGMNKAAARFDYAKLESLNAHYIKEADNERLIDLVSPFLQENHDIIISKTGLDRLQAGMDGLKDRSKTLVQLAEESVFYLVDEITYDEKALKNLNLDSSSLLKEMLNDFKNLDEVHHDSVEAACRALADRRAEGKLGKVMMPLRSALTGTDKSPSLFEVVEILGKGETCTRIQAAIDFIEKAS